MRYSHLATKSCIFRNEDSWSSYLFEDTTSTLYKFLAQRRRLLTSRYSDPIIDPGGRMVEPKISDRELLDLRIYPRHNIYLSNDRWAGFLVDAKLSYTMGDWYCSTLDNGTIDVAAGVKMDFSIFRTDTGQTVVEKIDVPINATGVQAQFRLADFEPRMEPYEVTLKTTRPRCGRYYQAATKIYVLPAKADGGSAVRIDYKYGGVSVNTSPSNKEAVWNTLFPFSFYVDWGDYLSKSVDALQHFANQGYNIIHPTPGSGLQPWNNWTTFDEFMTRAEKLGIYVMYDMRWTYKNLTSVKQQVARYKSRKNVLTWYTGDEPDGNGDPLDATTLAYDAIKEADPYHPVSLVLNCDNYHYKEYSAGADIIMTDPYPVGTNMTFSRRHNTFCNSQFGDCGCDDCEGDVQDVSRRLDRYTTYQDILGNSQKIFWGVPQAFGNAEYWNRTPTAAEEVVMAMLFINHGAKGIVAWNYPTTPELANVTSKLAQAIAGEESIDFLLWARPQRLTLSAQPAFDAAAWRVGKFILVSIVYLRQQPYGRELKLGFGVNAKAMKMLWPPDAENWFLGNKSITKSGMDPLEVNVFLVETE